MNGTILNFDASTGTGILRADDGKRYRFLSSDWSSDGAAQTGDVVDFEIDGTNATDIFVLKRASSPTNGVSPILTPQTSALAAADTRVMPSAGHDVAPPLGSDALAASTLERVPAMPAGKSALFFVGYLLTMIPTYILPYFGSNSLVFNSIGKLASGGMPMQFWWHLTCYAVLMFLAYSRGIQMARGWLVSLPIVAMVFEFVPGLSYIPLVPTGLNLAALFIGTTRSAPPGFTPENVAKRTEWSLWTLAIFCALVLISLFTSNMSFGSPFKATLLIWPVFGATIYYALQFRTKDNPAQSPVAAPSEGALEPGVRNVSTGSPVSSILESTDEIPAEDQAGATPAPDDGTPATTSGIVPWLKTLQGRIAAGATVLVVAGGIALFASQNKRAEFGEATDAAAAAGAAAVDPSITGQEATLYVIADANVRDRATAQGSTIVTKILRGTALIGTMEIGTDQTSAWFKLTDGRGYIGGVNLSPKQPPALAKTFTDMKWNVETGTDLLDAPAAGSAIVARLNTGDQTTIAGVTTNGFAEVKRSRGGVGYFLVNAGNDRNGTLFVENIEDAADRGTVTGSIEASERRAVVDILNLDGATGTEYAGTIGDQITTVKFSSDTAKQLLFGNATYQNAVTKKICETIVQFQTASVTNVMRLGQGITKYGTPCRHHATMVVRPVVTPLSNTPPNALDVDWMLGSQKLMSGRLTLIDVS